MSGHDDRSRADGTPAMSTPEVPSPPETVRERVTAELTAALFAEHQSADDTLPPALAARLVADGERWFARAAVDASGSSAAPSMAAVLDGSDTASHGAVPSRAPAAAPTSSVTPITSARRAATSGARGPDVWRWSGWIAAAAAVVAWVALPSGARGPSTQPTTVGATDASTPQAVQSVPDAGRLLREALLAANPRAFVMPWSATEDVAAIGASGDMLWSAEAQRGVMRIVGLAANDPRRLQYQLWIFDATRDERYPVDGGVFDVPAGATEVLVPVQPRVPVGEATLFAVTVERPGGVVVSDRERIVLLAQR